MLNLEQESKETKTEGKSSETKEKQLNQKEESKDVKMSYGFT